ncbi:Uncharacterized protein APZ42_005236 [Daphnia magna]|uniref:Uncharacterized protein n=1 Tax=Daphnia magna TaxID=35525 RepID=A0A162BYR0_9CRUS|nr:Uncharacterized protein APZ42_005236 [Daphnia magna]
MHQSFRTCVLKLSETRILLMSKPCTNRSWKNTESKMKKKKKLIRIIRWTNQNQK